MERSLDEQKLRSFIEWHREYRPEWDGVPDNYAHESVVQWGRSRRLGLFQRGVIKAYLGVQHVDPDKPGWRIVDEPQARFFVSIFVMGRCVTLRTCPDMRSTLAILASWLPEGD